VSKVSITGASRSATFDTCQVQEVLRHLADKTAATVAAEMQAEYRTVNAVICIGLSLVDQHQG
jgi:hypothetical protein